LIEILIKKLIMLDKQALKQVVEELFEQFLLDPYIAKKISVISTKPPLISGLCGRWGDIAGRSNR